MNRIKQHAFTIIELLLVIAVIGVMASLGVSLFHQRAEAAKIHKTALQTEQILQAGMAYYVDHRKWPEGHTHQLNPDFEPYLPVGSTLNPYGIDFWYGPAGNSTKFEVDTQVRTNSQAKQVVAMLPNAIVPQDNNKQVKAQVTVPGQSQTDYPIFAGAGHLNDRQIVNTTCPAKYHACLAAALDHFYMDRKNPAEKHVGVHNAGCSFSEKDKTWQCSLTTTDDTSSSHVHNVSGMFVLYCISDKTPGCPNSW